jgi:hypothetical protein
LPPAVPAGADPGSRESSAGYTCRSLRATTRDAGSIPAASIEFDHRRIPRCRDMNRLAIESRELYWLPDGGLSESELDLKALAAIIGPTTIRTKGTIDRIVARHCG